MMLLYDFHHHHPEIYFGIYNLPMLSAAAESPFSAGIHPKDAFAGQQDFLFSWLSNIAEHPLCVAIGECGLDQNIPVPQKIQTQFFRKQINLSNELKKPIIVHCVKKYYDVIALKKYAEQPMVIHGFNKNQKVAEDLLAHNFYLSFGKAALYSLSLQHTLKLAPLDKIFLETDDKDFDITELYHKTAALKNIPTADLAAQISENLQTLRHG